MKVPRTVRPLLLALIAAGVIGSSPANAVRVDADGHGQALIYPYYTARSTASGNAYVTAMSVINIAPKPKALKVRFLEGKTGAEVFDFNLFLAAYDVWTAGIVGAGAGAGIFSRDNSCTIPKVSNSAANPTKFRNAAYIGDLIGDQLSVSLDRTYEGYFEVLEMGAIDPTSALGMSVTPSADSSVPNAAKPSCSSLPSIDTPPAGLSIPTGGLVGNASYINVNDGTAYSIAAIALSQWSERVQWSAAGNAHPNLADASPATSYVVDTREDGDLAFVSRWSSGRDAVTALFMVNRVRNEFSIEPQIGAATDWVLTLPTKRFHVNTTRSDPPFGGGRVSSTRSDPYWCEVISLRECILYEGYFDREGQPTGCDVFWGVPLEANFCGTASFLTFTHDYNWSPSRVFQSSTSDNIWLDAPWINGWYDFPARSISHDLSTSTEVSRLVGAAGATTIINTATGQVIPGATVTYFGLPIVGFAAQSFSNGSLMVGQSTVLSNYGGQFNHKFTRRIEVAP